MNVGVFTSLSRAKTFIKALPRKHPYAVYKLPTNTKLVRGRKLEDVQGHFDHWHFGTNEVERIEMDEDGNILSETRETIFEWPE